MDNLRRYAASLFLVLLLAGCGGGSGGGSDGLFTPTLPADAARIDAANADAIAHGVFESIDNLSMTTFSFKSEQALPSFRDILRSVTDRVKISTMPSAMTAYRTEVEDCEVSSPQGTITIDFEETETSADGSAVFRNCVIAGITIEGRLTFDSSFNNTTFDYSDHFNGSLTVSAGSDSFTLVFDISETGNASADTYSTRLSFSVSGLPGGGFLVTTTQPLVGDNAGISAGEIVVQGAENTRLRIRVTGLNTAAVDLDEGSGYISNFLTCTDLDFSATCSP